MHCASDIYALHLSYTLPGLEIARCVNCTWAIRFLPSVIGFVVLLSGWRRRVVGHSTPTAPATSTPCISAATCRLRLEIARCVHYAWAIRLLHSEIQLPALLAYWRRRVVGVAVLLT